MTKKTTPTPDAAAIAKAVNNYLLNLKSKSFVIDDANLTRHIEKIGFEAHQSSNPIGEYDPSTCITAGELRSFGLPIANEIPDCGWVPRSAWGMKAAAAEHSQEDIANSILRLDTFHTFTEPFRWVQIDATITKPNTP